MKRKLLSVLLLILLLLTGSTSCLLKPSVEKDLSNYVRNELPTVFDLESRAVDAYSSVSGTNYTNDQNMYNKMKSSVIPDYTKFVNKLENIKPKTTQVKNVHAIYLSAAKTQLKAFNEIVTALEKQDINLINQANTKLSAARDGISEFKTKLESLCNENHVNTPW